MKPKFPPQGSSNCVYSEAFKRLLFATDQSKCENFASTSLRRSIHAQTECCIKANTQFIVQIYRHVALKYYVLCMSTTTYNVRSLAREGVSYFF